VRYCLECSIKEGRLVERVCPVVERKRAAAKERTAKKAATKRRVVRERREERAAYEDYRYTFDGVDLRGVVRQYAKLRAWKGVFRGRVPELTVRLHRGAVPPKRWAFADPGQWRVHLALHR